MTEQEKKEFEEFLKWKKERQANSESVVKEKNASTPPPSPMNKTEQENAGDASTYNRNEKVNEPTNETALNKPSTNNSMSYLLTGGIILIIVFMTIGTCNSTDKEETSNDDSYTTESIDTVATAADDYSPTPRVVTWTITSSKDEMTDTKNIWAKITSDNYISQDFPYEGCTFASITVRYMKKYGYDVLIEITQGQIDGRKYYGTDYITARFDDGAPKKYHFNEAADGSSEVVFLRNHSDFIKRCKQAKDIKIDIPIYQSGRPVFTFHVDEPLVWPED